MKIEEYLHINREKLDNHEPDAKGMWGNINYKLIKRKQYRIHAFRWIAASILVFLLVGTLVRHEIIVQKQITSLSQINKELAAKESKYHHQVNQKWVEYNEIEGNPSPIEPMLIDELKQLDIIYNDGLTDIKEKGYNERAVIILLDTYEKRLRIIEKLIYEKQKQINYESKDRKIEI